MKNPRRIRNALFDVLAVLALFGLFWAVLIIAP